MINTLYSKMVLTFIGVVFISVTASFFITYNMYEERVVAEIEEELMVAGKGIIELSKVMEPESVENYIEKVSTIRYNIALYSEDGKSKFYGEAKPDNYATPDEVEEVLAGGVHRITNKDRKLFHYASVGLPFELNGKKYALFLKPGLAGKLDFVRRILKTVLFNVLMIGSLLYLFVALYFVSPIKKLTAFTSKVAKGNFHEQVSVKRKDEIGELAESFNRMNKELHSVEKMRREFISNVSHDLQSPLMSIKGFARALKEHSFPKEQQDQYLTIIEKESERLGKLSANLLQLSVLESKENPTNKEWYRLDQQIRQVFLSHQPQWLDKGIVIDLEDVHPAELSADKDQLEQVWHNLLTNSIKFTDHGGEITVSLKEEGERIVVVFSDTGVGISEEDVPHIFDRFFMVDRARESSKQGSGLGLSIVKKIIDVHHGSVDVTSKANQGTTFTFTLPKSMD
ncbi:HAMP domain-containing histidine kinase [Rossellomorea aquimaris]|uniref:HAMP domain-containing sensor histidine kinase n=1 Tax=Rossellomorea TaxID=2837508 RepID=UPI001CD1D330|nr:HAMP domain-containing sensor histidine kinase [Rossellomorea aquimaris]MCA1060401.1 HAMP domain-containing histidine kinase [Rossellomorea aquimaris]